MDPWRGGFMDPWRGVHGSMEEGSMDPWKSLGPYFHLILAKIIHTLIKHFFFDF